MLESHYVFTLFWILVGMQGSELDTSRELILPCGWRHGIGTLSSVHREKGQPFCQGNSCTPLKQLLEVLPEPLTHKDINKWVDTAVGVGNSLSYHQGQVQLLVSLALTGE